MIENLSGTEAMHTVALGNFDGVHSGHRALLTRARAIADETNKPLLVWTFPTLPTPAITPTELRAAWLMAYGAEVVLFEDFEKVRDLSPEDFVKTVLVDTLHTATCVCGYNYSFGRGGKGDAALLKSLLASYGVRTEILPEIKGEAGATVSSTALRRLLKDGQIEEATARMGHPYLIRATVEKGRRVGRTLGFPTVNQPIDPTLAPVKQGVYASFCLLDGLAYPAVTNIGIRPTFEKEGRPIAETHILGLDADLYGQTLTVGLLAFLREEKPFSSEDALIQAVEKNKAEAEKVFASEKARNILATMPDTLFFD